MPLLGITEIGALSLQVCVGDVEKAGSGHTSTRDRQGNLLPLGNTVRCLSQAPMVNVVQLFWLM